MSECLLCQRIQLIKEGLNPYFIAELETGYVVAGDHQFFKGYTLFLCKQHVPELHQLPTDFKVKFLVEMSLVAEAVYEGFQPKTMNYEALGNSISHLHWHLFPRHATDPNPTEPVWKIDQALRYSDEFVASGSELKKHKQLILVELTRFSGLNVLSRFC